MQRWSLHEAGIHTHQTHKLKNFFRPLLLMETIISSVIQGLAPFALEELKLLWNAKDDAERMKNTVLAIGATLLDAEEKGNNNNHQDSLWLARLKDVLYDADDLLDDLFTEALRRKIMTKNKAAKKVRIFFSKSNQLVYNRKMAHELKGVRERLDEICAVKKNLQSNDQPPKPLAVLEERKETDSFVQEDEIIGREEEKDIILHYLLDSNVKSSSISIIPIVGFGGLGKTALAQLVFNHEGVRDYFEFRKWVCVSDEFDVKQLAQKILGQGSPNEMEQVRQDIRKLIEGKKFLIVLDDVWNQDVQLWHKLNSLLDKGAKGSMIIVTTRSETVGKMMGTYEPIILKGLDGERSLELFCKMAFVGSREPHDKELLEIGREVVEKCGGVPLAIRAFGSLMREKTLEGITDLSYLRNCALWNVDKSLEERVFAVLKLSYDHLPSQMKNCVSFCSLFPKDFLLEKQTLIKMWVAEGFIESSEQRCEEDVGHEYFLNLLSRSFFQDVTRDLYGNIVTCKMHDLVHDLAQFVAKHEHLVIREGKEERTRDTTRHWSCDVPDDFWKVPTSFLNFEKLRTILFFNHKYLGFNGGSVFDLAASKLKCLRVLKLNRSLIAEIPESIGNLKHLRFLDLSGNPIRHVPNAVTRLHNLHTLNLRFTYIRELPRDISKLVSLRHLHVKFSFLRMPSGLGQLTCLQTLTVFAVDNQKMQGRRGSAGIRELGELNSLRGSLRIRQLKHLRSNPEEAESAKLQQKQHLERLSLIWDEYGDDDVVDIPNEVAADELILERLRPHRTIKTLVIESFRGAKLPEWIGSLLELQHLVLCQCEYLKSLPEGLPNLKSLRSLNIIRSPLLPDDELRKFDHIPCLDPLSLIDHDMDG